jgi:HD superfamily phosphohydrolase
MEPELPLNPDPTGDFVRGNSPNLNRFAQSELAQQLMQEDVDLPPVHQEFFVPVHGFIRFYEEELRIINHPAFQRLGKVNQLGATNMVYRGATHQRLEHALGTVHVAEQICHSIEENHGQLKAKGSDVTNPCALAKPLSEAERRFVRLAALLHDIAHLPSGHTLEDELCLIEKHDSVERITRIFDKKIWHGITIETSLAELINKDYSRWVPKSAKNVKPVEILLSIIAKKATPATDKIKEFRFSVCQDLVGNTICADLLDYLYRDWYHIGKPLQTEARIYQYFQIRKDSCDSNAEKLVVSLGHRERPKRDSISAILGLLESRYNLFESVLFHPTKCAASAMLERALLEIWAAAEKNGGYQGWLSELEEKLLECSDEESYSLFIEHANRYNSRIAVTLLDNLALRRIHKSFALFTKASVDPDLFDRLQGEYLDAVRRKKAQNPLKEVEFARAAALKRHQTLKTFESDFALEPGSIVMYCPPARMSAKLQEVKILNGQSIRTLEKWDASNDARAIAGGHCEAQIRRFESLWRIEVFVSSEVKLKASQNPAFSKSLKAAIKVCLIGDQSDPSSIDASFNDVIVSFAPHLPEGVNRIDQLSLAARNSGDFKRYPMGAPIWAQFQGVPQ